MKPCKRLENLEIVVAHIITREKAAMEDIAELQDRIRKLEAKAK